MELAYLFALFIGALVLKRAAEGPQAKFSRVAGLLLGLGLTLTYAFENTMMRHAGFYLVCAGLVVLTAMFCIESVWSARQTARLLRERKSL